MDTVTYAALGAGAIGTVLYGIYAARFPFHNFSTAVLNLVILIL
jgi:hypothetical protein